MQELKFKLANNMASSVLGKMLGTVKINTLAVLVLVCPVILWGHRYSGRCSSHSHSIDILLCMWQMSVTRIIMLADIMPMWQMEKQLWLICANVYCW